MAAWGHHRAAGVIDLLTAAVAEHHAAVVLHQNADFEHIAASTGQPHVWIIPRGPTPQDLPVMSKRQAIRTMVEQLAALVARRP